MKYLVLLTIFSIFLQFAVAEKKMNTLRVLNLQYTKAATHETVKQAFKSKVLYVTYDPENEDLDQVPFEFVWKYDCKADEDQGKEIYEKIKDDFDNITADGEDRDFIIRFSGKDIQSLKFYKKTEFGSAYILEISEKGVIVQVQLQIKPHEPNDDEFHSLIEKIVEKRTPQEFLQFLQH